MAFCSKCGSEVGTGTAFCPNCGAAQTSGPPMVESSSATPSGMSENVAGLLCYLLFWVTGIIFFVIDKRPFVRFHAAQSMVVFGGLYVLRIVLGIIFGTGIMLWGGNGAFGIEAAIYDLLRLVTLVLWILLMVKAYQHEKFEVPIAAGIAKSFSGT